MDLTERDEFGSDIGLVDIRVVLKEIRNYTSCSLKLEIRKGKYSDVVVIVALATASNSFLEVIESGKVLDKVVERVLVVIEPFLVTLEN